MSPWGTSPRGIYMDKMWTHGRCRGERDCTQDKRSWLSTEHWALSVFMDAVCKGLNLCKPQDSYMEAQGESVRVLGFGKVVRT